MPEQFQHLQPEKDIRHEPSREFSENEHQTTPTDHLGHAAVSGARHERRMFYAKDKQFDAFYRHEYELLLRFARRKLPSREDAEDVLAEAMIGVWNRWNELKTVLNEPSGESQVRSFTHGVVIRRVYDFYRQYYKYGTFMDINDIEIASDNHPELYIASWDIEPLINSLPPQQATVLRMAMLGASRGEIAEILDLSVNRVRNCLSFARKNLRKLMILENL